METYHSQIGRSIPKHHLMHVSCTPHPLSLARRNKEKRIDSAWVIFLVILLGNLGQSISRLRVILVYTKTGRMLSFLFCQYWCIQEWKVHVLAINLGLILYNIDIPKSGLD